MTLIVEDCGNAMAAAVAEPQSNDLIFILNRPKKEEKKKGNEWFCYSSDKSPGLRAALVFVKVDSLVSLSLVIIIKKGKHEFREAGLDL